MLLAHNIDEGQRTKDIHINQDVTFDSMLLSVHTLQGLRKAGFYRPSPVQLLGIPLGKCGFDLILEAKSGTGKTAVFSVIALEKLDLNKGLQAIILAPTREIAFQISDVLKQIGSNYHGLIIEVVIGGLPVEEDISKLKKNVHILVGSPGRLRHLIQDKHIDVSSVRLIVLDEADKLMEKSFQPDINYIFSISPSQKQVILSSATYPENTRTFIGKYVVNAQYVCPNSNCILLGIEQKITVVKFNTNIVRQTQFRFEELLKILSKKPFKQCLIFCNYQARVAELHKLLTRAKWPVEQLYGQQEQIDRLDALKTLKEYKCRILISTDLAARGIDASNVDLVINFEVPFDWPTYLHRIGRAGRYGSYGMSVTIVSKGKEEEKFRTMLGSMQDTLKITTLWDNNNKINFNSSAKTLPANNGISHSNQQTANKDNFKELWNLFRTEETIKDIECFESLCESYEKTKNENLESFDDLLESFKSVQNGNLEKEEYKHMEIKTVSINQLIKDMKELNTSFDNLHLPPHSNNNQNVSKGDKNDIRDKTLKSSKNEKTLFEKSHSQNEKEVHMYSNNNELLNVNVNINNEKNCLLQSMEIESSCNALLEAGLPLSFGSSKNKVNNNKEKTDSKNKNPETKNKLNSRKQNTYGCEFQTISKDSYCTTTRQNNQKNRKNELLLQNSNKKYQNKKTKPEQYKTKEKDKNRNYYLSEDYLYWYNNLKFKVKQFEYALYVEEITRI